MIRLIIFDMDGVILDVPSSWIALWSELKLLKERQKTKERYDRGEISYKEWVDIAMDLYRKKGLTEERFNEIVYSTRLMPGAKETVAELKKRGYKTAIISDGVKQFGSYLKKILGVDYVAIPNILLFKDGKLSGATVKGWGGSKTKIFSIMCEGLKINKNECAMVGHDWNDVEIFKEVGLSIAFCPATAEVESAAKIVIRKKDLRELLKHFPTL